MPNEIEVKKEVLVGEVVPDDFCYDCKRVVERCWGNGLCSGGGHCQECMGYSFSPPEID